MAGKKSAKTGDLLRRIPSVDQLLNHGDAAAILEEFGRDPLTGALRSVLDDLRRRLKAGTFKGDPKKAVSSASVLDAARERLERRRRPDLCRAVNATGVILHTNLGRAVLPPAAMDAIASEQRGYSLLEADRDSGERGTRETHVVRLLTEITGAEAATMVNNNAGATLLILATLAKGMEVVASRGQLVEIGGSFRIPDVMKQSGAKLVEVGSTNKTYLADYENAITENTALPLRVHTSHYRIMGFTHPPSLEELVALGARHGLPVMDDLGSGALIDLAPHGLTGEPTPQESIRVGADVVCFSGDKLLGGPQAGIIVGKKELVRRIRKNPLFRALRPDKLALTAMEATLKLYLDPDRLLDAHPTLRMITAGADEIERRALALASRLQGVAGLTVEILDDASEIGGGSVPAQAIPTKVVAVRHASLSPDDLAARLRANTPCIMCRIKRERTLFDVRTLLEGDAEEIAEALERIG
ncbi:MAG: L-seryl-tRNA(Sec) selenium transferase [Planctomycetota bacterium]|jgi:L-seryl-tRNA(Ser) seleniumtransferase